MYLSIHLLGFSQVPRIVWKCIDVEFLSNINQEWIVEILLYYSRIIKYVNHWINSVIKITKNL